MKNIHTHSRSSLFLTELIIAIFIFALSCAACLHIYATSRQNYQGAQNYRKIQSLVTSVGEILEGTDGTFEAFSDFLPEGTKTGTEIIWYYDSNWQSSASEGAAYKMIFTSETSDFTRKGTLSFYKNTNDSDNSILYQTQFEFPIELANTEDIK